MDGAVRECGQLLIVGNDDEGLAELVAEVKEELVQLCLVLTIKGATGLVGQNDGRVVDEGTGHCHTLFLTTAELIGLMGSAVAQPHEVKQFGSTVSSIFFAGTCDISGYHDVLYCRKLRQ